MKNLRATLHCFLLFVFLLLPSCSSNGQERKETEHAHTNRLINEKSPYLQQHAHNPVDWYPWSEEAFEKARSEDKPIFLSIGYSTCHWCHVMERESFESEEVAAILNQHYIAVKVDREERPDVDNVYMTFVQATTGGGGWPLSVWLTPDLKPFIGGTYFPPEDRGGRLGFKNILTKITELWQTKRDEIIDQGNATLNGLREMVNARQTFSLVIDESLLSRSYQQIAGRFDPVNGGFGTAPKFPRPVTLNFLFRYGHSNGEQRATDMALTTLRKMASGGMYDHIGGGFHRYSVDERWHVPHFEKMLYDQAQIAISYLEAYRITHDPEFERVARDVLDYVLRNMTGGEGQFFSAEDADSPLPENPEEQGEGAFYVWEESEIEEILGKEASQIFNDYFGVEPKGNVRNDPFVEFPQKNVLYVAHTIEETAKKFDQSPEEIEHTLAEARAKLYNVRKERPRPHLDDKTITAWNGLMISAFAQAYQTLGDVRYLEAAEQAAAFVRDHLYNKKTRELLRRYRDGESAIAAYADDYAFLIQGLLDLYEASFDVSLLIWAINLQEQQNRLFLDKENGGYYETTGNDSTILLRMKDSYDGAEPSPNSVSVMNLLRLGEMTDNEEYRSTAERIFQIFGSDLERAPAASPQLLAAVDFAFDKPKQIVIAGKQNDRETESMLQAVWSLFLPNRIILFTDGGAGQEALAEHLEFIESIAMIDGKPTVYVCENYVCKLPTNDVDEMVRLLKE